jgi:hypothetical protein
MGWVEMSERELRRAEVLASVFAGRLTMTAAADLMDVTRRQAHRLARQFADTEHHHVKNYHASEMRDNDHFHEPKPRRSNCSPAGAPLTIREWPCRRAEDRHHRPSPTVRP